jgi:histone deacetylase complex regulatory component SIN3
VEPLCGRVVGVVVVLFIYIFLKSLKRRSIDFRSILSNVSVARLSARLIMIHGFNNFLPGRLEILLRGSGRVKVKIKKKKPTQLFDSTLNHPHCRRSTP